MKFGVACKSEARNEFGEKVWRKRNEGGVKVGE
jgi:hypothetical protein